MRQVAIIRSIQQSIRALQGVSLNLRRDIDQALTAAAQFLARVCRAWYAAGTMRPDGMHHGLRLSPVMRHVGVRVTGGACPTPVVQCSTRRAKTRRTAAS